MDSNIAAWMINGGRDPFDGTSERDRIHLQALREAQANRVDAGPAREGLLERLRLALRPTPDRAIDPACCPA